MVEEIPKFPVENIDSKDKCERCGFSDKRALEDHHKNRIHKDNNPKNKQRLCSNCHQIEHYEEARERIKSCRNNGKERKVKIIGLISQMALKKDRERAKEILILLGVKI